MSVILLTKRPVFQLWVKKKESVGWAIAGWTAKKVGILLNKLKKNHLTGEGPQTLKEKRDQEQARREEERRVTGTSASSRIWVIPINRNLCVGRHLNGTRHLSTSHGAHPLISGQKKACFFDTGPGYPFLSLVISFISFKISSRLKVLYGFPSSFLPI